MVLWDKAQVSINDMQGRHLVQVLNPWPLKRFSLSFLLIAHETDVGHCWTFYTQDLVDVKLSVVEDRDSLSLVLKSKGKIFHGPLLLICRSVTVGKLHVHLLHLWFCCQLTVRWQWSHQQVHSIFVFAG